MRSDNTAFSEPNAAPRSLTALRDRFVLEERLEQGRFGTMYRAFDRARGQDGRAYVAILVLPREIARNAEQMAAFERELASIRALSHPNIVQMFALERDGDTSFLVLEWVDGESLRSVIDGLAPETVCEADAFDVVRAVGNALVYAHTKGVVHGDIRPENVLVTERGDVRLLFASACLARAAPFTVSPRDDVRDLAALAYELMAGRPPPVPALYPHGRGDEPMPIDGLSRKRWKALKSALGSRGGRIASVRQLLTELDLPAPPRLRSGGRPDRIRSTRRRGFGGAAAAVLFVVGVAALAAAGAALWSRDASLPELASWRADVGARAEVAADASRSALAGAREGLATAAAAVSAGWNGLGRRIADASPDEPAPAVARGEQRDSVAAARSADAPQGSAAAADADSAGGAQPVSAPSAGEREPVDRGGEAATGDADTRTGSGSTAEPVERGGEGTTSDADTRAGSGSSVEPAEPASRGAPDETAARGEAVVTARDTPAASAAAGGSEPAAPAPDGRRAASSDAAGRVGLPGESARAAAPAAPRIAFTRDNYVVSESAGMAAIEVQRQNGTEGAVSFVWWTRDGTAKAGDDYADLGRVVEQLAAGATTTTLYVPITSDSIVEEQHEQFEIFLGVLSAEGNQNGAIESATVTIVDDDR